MILKIERTILSQIDEKEANHLYKKGVFYVTNDNLDITIYDIDKQEPKQLVEFLLKWKKKNRKLLILIIIIFVILWLAFLAFLIANRPTQQTSTIQLQPTQPTPIIQPTQTQSITPIQTKTIQLQPTQTQAITPITVWISEKELDLIFCEKDNQSLDKFNNELIKKNTDLEGKIFECEKTKDVKTDFYISIWKNLSSYCLTATGETETQKCSKLINNYYGK